MSDHYDPNAYGEQPQTDSEGQYDAGYEASYEPSYEASYDTSTETGYDTADTADTEVQYDATYEANYDGYDSTAQTGYDIASADTEQRFYAQTEFMNDPVGAVGHVGEAIYEAGEFAYHGAQTVYAVATGDDEARDRHMAEQQRDIDQSSDALLNAADDLGLPIYNTEPRPEAETETETEDY